MAYHEPPGPEGVAPKHRKTALDIASKKKSDEISNAEIAPTPESNEITEKNKKLAADLHEMMFDKVGGAAGYSCKTEYHVGVGRINEELHCIFGSTMKSIGSQPFITGDLAHIEEELGLIEDDIVEYRQDLRPYKLDNDEKTVANANRVLNHLDVIDVKLNLIDKQTERDEVTVELASKSSELMRKIALIIIRHPSPEYESGVFKPFRFIEDDVKDLRNYFETEYKPKFPR